MKNEPIRNNALTAIDRLEELEKTIVNTDIPRLKIGGLTVGHLVYVQQEINKAIEPMIKILNLVE